MKRRRGTRYLDERQIRGAVAIDNAARSTKVEPHNRRKPGLASVTDAEVSDVGAGKVTGTLADANIPQLPKGKIQTAGVWAKADLPGDVQYGRPRGADIDWQDRSVPKRAIDSVGWGQVDDKPNVVTAAETQKFLTRKEADKLYRRK